MKDVLKLILAIAIIVVAWKLLKFALSLAIGIAVVGLIVYGGVKLLGGPKRLK